MAHDHHHHHHPHRDAPEEPLDAANQSLSDALRASFGILKIIMLIIVVLYLFSNVRGIRGHEEVLVLRMGRLLPTVRDAGLSWAFPYPIDEVVRLPTKKSNELTIASHSFFRRPNEVGKPLSFVTERGGGLNPSLDGSLLTSDAGLVHVQWKVTYKIDDVVSYVTHLAGQATEAAESLIETLVETTGIDVAGELTAEEFTRTRVDDVQGEMLRRINLRLAGLSTGISVSTVEMFEPTPPLAVRASFNRTQQAENAKEKRIREARREQTRRLNEVVGSVYPELVAALDVRQGGDHEANREEIFTLLERAEGEVGQLIQDARAYFSVVVGRMRSDVETYRTLVPEFERDASMLVERLWEETRIRIFTNPNVSKIYRPPGLKEFRVLIPVDPEEKRAEEKSHAQDKKFDINQIRPKKYHVVGPEYD